MRHASHTQMIRVRYSWVFSKVFDYKLTPLPRLSFKSPSSTTDTSKMIQILIVAAQTSADRLKNRELRKGFFCSIPEVNCVLCKLSL